jgi:FtsP/CotA-like multicopper oxidase with cupredoxin domain
MTAHPISRRRAVQLAGLGATSVAVGAVGWLSHLGEGSGSLNPATGEPLRDPTVLASAEGLLDVHLTAASGVRLAGRSTSGFGYNGTSPGPTLRVRPGDLLRIRLTNRLDQPTNLHTHGLHVSPTANGDNPFVTIEPGAAFDYAYRIPSDHPPGTLWYHPHHHGHVAEQIFAGLAGALIVEDTVTAPAAERTLVITDTTIDGAGRVVSSNSMSKMMGREGQWILINGQLAPTLTGIVDSTQRWRIVNACTSRVLSLRLDQHRVTQLGIDGSTLPTPREVDRLVLAPGNRGDLLIRPAGAGRYSLISEAYDRGSPGMGMGGGASSTSGPAALATLLVTTGSATTPPPRPPATAAVPDGPIAATRHLTFAMGMNGGMGGMGSGGMAFTIDGRTFNADRTDQTARLGSVEEWLITNTSPMDHPFHLHVWPFQVIQDSTGSFLPGVPQDVVLVPAHGWTRIRVHLSDYPGRSVYHCHILDHEDAGMMGTVQVDA